jgi:hypothetical protein
MKNDDPLAGVGLRSLPRSRSVAISFAVLLGAAFLSLGASETQAQSRDDLRPPTAFVGITDAQARSRALFTEAFKVIGSPRCMNCHPAGDRPLQGTDQHPHFPPVLRGADGGGVPGNTCRACHTDRNFTIVGGEGSYQSIPGHPRWGLAPIEMAWEGKSPGEICTQLKDRNRNGGRDLALLHEHLAKDDLIAWGWNPGLGRAPVPGTQARLGELIQAWIDTGAHCP